MSPLLYCAGWADPRAVLLDLHLGGGNAIKCMTRLQRPIESVFHEADEAGERAPRVWRIVEQTHDEKRRSTPHACNTS